jgi:acyl-coenzyme A thioesterase PaaI-like protein
MYGGYLNALCMKAALSVAGTGHPHPLTMNIEFIAGVKKNEAITVLVQTTKSTRKLRFMRLSIETKDGVVVTASCLFGRLASDSTAATRLESPYDLATQLEKVPGLKDGVGSPNILADAVETVPGAKAMDLTSAGPLRYMDFFNLCYPKEATSLVSSLISVGRLRKENWESVHALPYSVSHPSGRKPDFLSAAFYSDLFPASKNIEIGFGPIVPSVTISLSLHFCKPVSPGSTKLYMASNTPYLDRAIKEETGEGFVEAFESVVWGEGGELVCLQRQQRVVVGREPEKGTKYEMAGGTAKL